MIQRFHNYSFYLSQQQTKLTIFFEEDYIETKIRVETYTWGDFLAICGGLLGLFLGVSLLSVIELIYYSTLRLFWIAKWSKFKQNESQTQPKDASDVDENTPTNRNPTVGPSHS